MIKELGARVFASVIYGMYHFVGNANLDLGMPTETSDAVLQTVSAYILARITSKAFPLYTDKLTHG